MCAGAAKPTSRLATASRIRVCRASASATSASLRSPPWRPEPLPSAQPRELRGGVDRKADQAADQRTVDADELQVAADVALELVRHLGGIPVADARDDVEADVLPIALDPARRRSPDLLVDPVLHRCIGEQLLAK